MNLNATERWKKALESAFLENRAREGRFPQRNRFVGWDATPALAQATWEWPAGTPRNAFAQVADREALAWDRDWEQRGKHEFKRQLYGN